MLTSSSGMTAPHSSGFLRLVHSSKHTMVTLTHGISTSNGGQKRGTLGVVVVGGVGVVAENNKK